MRLTPDINTPAARMIAIKALIAVAPALVRRSHDYRGDRCRRIEQHGVRDHPHAAEFIRGEFVERLPGRNPQGGFDQLDIRPHFDRIERNASNIALYQFQLFGRIAGLTCAPAFAADEWINSAPLKLESLRGRVVLVEFWTFGCYNCRNTLPTIKKIDDTYRERGLTIIGVHTPEFDSEKRIENVRREISSLGIKYPVVTDNDYETWHAYNIQAWPTIVILDKQGRVRYTHIGEGLYDEEENVIKTLLAEKS